MPKNTQLLEGLDALANVVANVSSGGAESQPETKLEGNYVLVDIAKIVTSQYQPRSKIKTETIQSLAESIAHAGLIDPLKVRVTKNDTYELVGGHRRLQAVKILGWEKVPVICKAMSDQEAYEQVMIDNISEDILKSDLASAMVRYKRAYNKTQADIGTLFQLHQSDVSRYMTLEKMPDEVKELVNSGMTVKMVSIIKKCPKNRQIEFARMINGKSVEEAERILQAKFMTAVIKKTSRKNIDIVKLEQLLSEHVGSTVTISCNKDGAGRLIMMYSNATVLDGILEKIGATRN